METRKHIIAFAVEMGVALLENGAEIYRVEDTMTYILRSHGITNCNFYVHSGGIFASAGELTSNHVSFVRTVNSNSVNLARLIRLNQISRMFCKHTISLIEGWEMLDYAKHIPVYDWKIGSLACGIGCSGFTYIIGGSLMDALLVFFLGFFLWVWVCVGGKYKLPNMMINYMGSMATAGFSILMAPLHGELHAAMIIAGGIMVFVPGVLFSTSVREFLSERFLSGALHLLNAIMICLEITAGVASAYAIERFIHIRL